MRAPRTPAVWVFAMQRYLAIRARDTQMDGVAENAGLAPPTTP